jgi:hypothetical protein
LGQQQNAAPDNPTKLFVGEMKMTPKSKTDKKINLAFDTSKDKENIKKNITNSISNQFKSIKRKDVKKAVDDQYEELLKSASVTQHIPSVTEGKIRSEFRDIERKNKSISK